MFVSKLLNPTLLAWPALALLAAMAQAQASPPECPLESRLPHLAPFHLGGEIEVPSHLAPMVPAIRGAPPAIEVEFDGTGSIVCASPFSGHSFYWPYAIEAARRLNRKEVRQVIEFDEPGAVLRKRATGHPAPCAEPAFNALERAAIFLSQSLPHEATKCLDLAKDDSSTKFAAHYLRAMAAGLMDDERTTIAEYQEALSLMPDIYEAKIGIAISQRRAGHLQAAGATLLDAAMRAHSLPAQQRINDLRAYLYRDLRDRKSAAVASEEAFLAQRELHLRHPDPYSKAMLAFNARSLGIVLEEVGEFTKAEKYFAESVMRSYDEKVSEAVRFEADLGHARSLRKLGNVDAATNTCNQWRRRLNGIHAEFNDAHWGGRSVVQARWEFSCGSFERGVELLKAEMKRRPTSDISYLALEEGYRSRGETTLADQAHALSERVRTAHDRAILGAILSEADDLVRRGNVTVVEK